MTVARTYFVFLLSLVVVGPLHGQSTDSEAVLRPGDAVRITVWRNEELSGEFLIAEDGSIAHPILRGVQVTGVPLGTVEGRIRDLLGELATNPQFVVEPLLRVGVGGEVRQPSLYRLPPGTSLAEAVAIAGGATERGQLDRVRLVRDGEEIRVDLVSPEPGLAQQPVRSGDQIYVERRVSIFREFIAPAGSITSAIVALVAILTR